MIHKTIIVVLTLAAVAAGGLHIVTRYVKVRPLRRIVSLTWSQHVELVVREGFLEITYKDHIADVSLVPPAPSRRRGMRKLKDAPTGANQDQTAEKPPARRIIPSRRVTRNVARKEQIIGFDEWYEGRNWRCANFRIALWLLCVALGVYPVLILFRGPLLRHRRRWKGLCPRCGYCLTGNVTGACPECGAETVRAGRVATHRDSAEIPKM